MTDDPSSHPSQPSLQQPPPSSTAPNPNSILTMSNPPKRRNNSSANPMSSTSHQDILPTHHSITKDSMPDPRSRRRRLFLYMLAFAIMLALSSLLDVRRASLRNRSAKVKLSLPSNPLSSLSDGLSVANPENTITKTSPTMAHRDENASLLGEEFVATDSVSAPISSATASSGGDGEVVNADVNLSDQELKDDVDQLLAHVAEEEGSVANGTNVTSPSVPLQKPGEDRVKGLANSILGVVGAAETPESTLVNGVSPNATLGEGEVKLNSEEYFIESQKRMHALLVDGQMKQFADENDLRTLQALALQATRGDCEQKSGTEQSLFKTDAEAASNEDIERTDPLWGAWCLFSGSYKTDAMRDYVTKQRVVEDKMAAAKTAEESNVTSLVGLFDPNASSLDDVLTPEQQSLLRGKMDTIASHLHESDIRFLAALSLQATFGDCGSYGKETQVVVKEGESVVELRKLREALLDQTVVRKEGAQWGAWCVLQGKKRTSAAAELSHRVDLLIDQWTKSQTAEAPTEGEVKVEETGLNSVGLKTAETEEVLVKQSS